MTNVFTYVLTTCDDSHMTTTTAIKFNGRRAYRFCFLAGRWLPIAAAKAELMIATGQAENVTGTEAAAL